jgi:hypothetical protein
MNRTRQQWGGNGGGGQPVMTPACEDHNKKQLYTKAWGACIKPNNAGGTGQVVAPRPPGVWQGTHLFWPTARVNNMSACWLADQYLPCLYRSQECGVKLGYSTACTEVVEEVAAGAVRFAKGAKGPGSRDQIDGV